MARARVLLLALSLLVACAGMAWGDGLIQWNGAGQAQIPQADQPNATSPRDVVMSDQDTFEIRPTEHTQARVTDLVPAVSADVTVWPARPTDGRMGFVMYLKFVRDSQQDGQFATVQSMQDAIPGIAKEFVGDAVEGKVLTKPLKYAGRQGCYATFTDKRLVDVAQVKATEFRFAAAGMIRLSPDTVLQFRLLVSDLGSPDFFKPLEYALSFCKPIAATQPAK